MKIFTDTQGREWIVKLTIRSARKLAERIKPLGIDLMNIDQVLTRFADVLEFSDVIWETIKDQAKGKNISIEDFADSVSGDVLYQARQAWLEEYIDFSPIRQHGSGSEIF